MVRAVEDVGFVYLDNVEGYDPEKLFGAVEWFFSLSAETKKLLTRKQWNPESKNVYRGFFPVQPGETSHKEAFEIGPDLKSDDPDRKVVLYEPNVWPPEDGTVPFCETMTRYYDHMLRAGIEVMRLLALGSGMAEDTFDEWFLHKSLSTLRAIHYPQRDTTPPLELMRGDKVITCAEHADTGILTFLSTFHYSGLQIEDKDGKWIDVDPRPQSLVMDLLARVSKHHFNAPLQGHQSQS